MKKVIILSGECGDDEMLIAFIRLLLPQCRVHVVSKGTRAMKIFGSDSALAKKSFGGPEQNL